MLTRRFLVWLAAVTALVLVIYWPGLSGPLLLDDLPNLLPLKLLAEANQLSFRTVMADRLDGIDGRPAAMFTFFLNFKLTGDSIWWMKATNLLIHILCGVLVFGLSQLVLDDARSPRLDSAHQARWVAAAWLLAPIQVSTVLYTVQRMTSLAALFSLAALLAYLCARRYSLLHTRRARMLLVLALCVLWPLGMLSKQNAAVVPALVLVLELFFLSEPRFPPRPRWLLPALMVLTALPAGLLLLRSVAQPQWLDALYEVRDFTVVERLLTQARVLFDYGANVLSVPGGRGLGMFHDDFVVSRGVLDPPTTIVALGVLLVLVAVAVRGRHTSIAPLLGGVLFFIVGHGVESTVLPLEMYFEHRNYLPSLGLFMALAALFGNASRRVQVRMLVPGVMLMLLVGYGVLTAIRVDAWRNWSTLVQSSAGANPQSMRGRAALAVLAIEAGEVGTANVYLDQVLERGGSKVRLAVALKRLLADCIAGKQSPRASYDALSRLTRALDDPYTVAVLTWFAQVVSDGRCDGYLDIALVAGALDDLLRENRIRVVHRKRWSILRDVGIILVHAGRASDGVVHLSRAFQIAPVSRRADIERRLRAAGHTPSAR